MNRVSNVTIYAVGGALLLASAIFISWDFPFLLAGIVGVAWLIFWAAGWTPLPFDGDTRSTPITDIPNFNGKLRLDGVWTNGDPGEVPNTGWWVYRQFDPGDNLVYVGKTNSPRRRFAQHVDKDKAIVEHWTRWELYQCATKTEMDELEKLAVIYNNPANNVERWRLERYLGDGENIGTDDEESDEDYFAESA